MPRPLRVRVECYAGHRAEETPRRVWFGHRTVEVVDIIDRWLSPDHRYFKVRGHDEAVYILRHDEPTGRWELVFYQAQGGERSGGGPVDTVSE